MTETLPITIAPIGFVENDIQKPISRRDADGDPVVKREQQKAFHRTVKKTISRLVIDPRHESLLDGIEAFSHIVVLYWPHLLPEEERAIQKVHPMGRKDIPLQGIFATRSPARPNPVLVSTVKLLGRDKNILRVIGLEAFNGSPLIDIKPFLKWDEADGTPEFPEWIRTLHDEIESSQEE